MKETKEEMEEAVQWIEKKLQRIAKYEEEGRMSETVSQKLALEVMLQAYKNILQASPHDPQRELWERTIDLCHDQLEVRK